MSIIKCPVCGNVLNKANDSFVCMNKHSFDISAKGYVHLLPANRKNSREPGDNKQMVLARNAFLNAGYYQPVSEALNSIVLDFLKSRSKLTSRILDSGCGEGYYLDALAKQCNDSQQKVLFYGVDISKEAIRVAAGRNKNIFFAVASSFDLPVVDHSVDCLIQAFSPCSNDEFCRVLKKGGLLLSVIPGKRHLFGLKEILYDKPYENDEKEYPLTSFRRVGQVRVEYTMVLQVPEHIQQLLMMTPYYWRTNADKVKELAAANYLETRCEFIISTYEKD